MKLILLPFLSDDSSFKSSKKRRKNTSNKIFIASIDVESNRTLIIEEDEYSIWAYLLNTNMQGVDFDGFICSVVDPELVKIDPKEATKNGNSTPLTAAFSNQYSYVEGVKKKDIKIKWKQNSIEVSLKSDIYLMMDLNTKTSYSKGLSVDCYYGNKLQIDNK